MATDSTTLLYETRCFECLPPSQWQLIKLGLLKQILLGISPMADTSATALLEAAKCYICLPPGFWPLLELALLQQIAGGGGGGGGASLQCTVGIPVAPPIGACGLAVDSTTGTIYVFSNGAWA